MQGLDDEYWVPEHVREWLRGLGFSLPLENMEPHIRAWVFLFNCLLRF